MNNKLGRKIKRKQTKAKEKQTQKRIQEQMNMFDKIPSECLTCAKPFDKMSKEDAGSFRVVVRESEGKVNLYCDGCWNKAVNILQEFSQNKSNPLDKPQ